MTLYVCMHIYIYINIRRACLRAREKGELGVIIIMESDLCEKLYHTVPVKSIISIAYGNRKVDTLMNRKIYEYITKNYIFYYTVILYFLKFNRKIIKKS